MNNRFYLGRLGIGGFFMRKKREEKRKTIFRKNEKTFAPTFKNTNI